MPLDAVQRTTLVKTIEDRQARLKHDLRRQTLHLPELGSEVHDRGDESLSALLGDLEGLALQRDLREADALEKAAARIRGEDYGVCIRCGTDIPYARLLAEPAALRCVDCQNRHDASPPRSGSL